MKIPTKAVTVLLLAATACSPRATRSPAASEAIEATSADVHRFRIGALDAFALKDGYIRVPNDGKVVGLGQPPAAIAALLTAAGLPTDTIEFSIEPLLVKSGTRTMLFDTGAGSASFAVAGRLPGSLRSAGVSPAQVTDVFISHAHPDHVGGLVGAGGGLAFPNAVIHLSAPEWESMKSRAELAPMVAAITSKVATFRPGALVVQGVTAVPIAGHTPGHTGYEISSNGETLFFIGDAAHHSILSVQRPDWTIAFDEDQPSARISRRAVLQRAAEQDRLIYASHFPFPGLGHIRRRGDTFAWVPK